MTSLFRVVGKAAGFAVLMAMLIIGSANAGIIDTGAPVGTLGGQPGVGTFGFISTHLFAYDFTVPAGQNQLDSVEFYVKGGTDLHYTVDVCAVVLSACSAAPQFISAGESGTGTASFDAVTVTTNTAVNSGGHYFVYLFATSGTGTGRLGLSASTGSGENFYFQNGDVPTNPWTAGFAGNKQVATVLTFSFVQGGGGIGGDGGGGTVPEPGTASLFVIAAALVLAARWRR